MSGYTRRQCLRTGAGVAIGVGIAGCLSDDTADGEFPSDTIRHIVPYGEGGGGDTFARAFQPVMADYYGQSVEIDNVSGAGGLIGTEEAYYEEPDGYTIVSFNPPSTPGSYLMNPQDWDILDFEPIGTFGLGTWTVYTNADEGIEDMDDLIDRYQTGELEIWGGQEPGSVYHLQAYVFREELGLDWEQYVGYDGTGPVVENIASGEIPAGVATDGAAEALVEEDQVEPIAVIHSEGSEVFPDLPTFEDEGLPNLDWLGALTRCMFAPPETPQDIVDVHSEVLENTVNDEEIQEWAEETGQVVFWDGPDGTYESLESVMETIPELVDIDEIREETE